MMTDQIEGPHFTPTEARSARSPGRKLSTRTALIGAALLAVGVGGGATIAHMSGPSIEMAPVNPVAIKSLADDGGVISVRGKVAETFGPMVVVADATGRALVDLGRQGDGTGLVSAGQAVTVQGHFRHGLIRASFLVGADGKVVALHPMGPYGGPGGREGFRDGPREGGPHGGGPRGRGPDGRGPDQGPDAGRDAGPDRADAPSPAVVPTGNSAG